MTTEGQKSVIVGFDERAETVVQGLGTIRAVSYFDTSEAIDLIADLLTEVDRQKRIIRAISSGAFGSHTHMITAQEISRIVRGEP